MTSTDKLVLLPRLVARTCDQCPVMAARLDLAQRSIQPLAGSDPWQVVCELCLDHQIRQCMRAVARQEDRQEEKDE